MRIPLSLLVCVGLSSLLGLSACKKETVFVEDNEAPTANHVPRVKIENYVNRLFIDLLGREPIDAELETETQALKDLQLSKEARQALIQKLQSATDFVIGDTSYTQAFHWHLYKLAKARCLEGQSDGTILGFGDAEDGRSQAVVDARRQLQGDSIGIHELFARMVDNGLFDFINMNSFNFVNATFDNLLWRFPSQNEFSAGFAMVEHNQSAGLFGQAGQNKSDFIQIITQSREMFEGLIIWVYQQWLSRPPSSVETAALIDDFYQHRDIKKVLLEVLASDEYAGF
ncbi:MAG: hypothetical protein AAFP19_07740 [Bacteroidota bacterium]